MSKREEIFQQCVQLVLESSLRIILNEINIIRSHLGLPPRTEIQFYDEITNHLSTLEDFDFLGGPDV